MKIDGIEVDNKEIFIYENTGIKQGVYKASVVYESCEHEPYITMPTLNDGGIVQKCMKCGEFYR